MNRVLRQLVKHGAVRVEDGRIVPVRKPRQFAAVFHGAQLLLADAEETKIFNTARGAGLCDLLSPGAGMVRGARVVHVESDKTGSASGIAERAPKFNSEVNI